MVKINTANDSKKNTVSKFADLYEISQILGSTYNLSKLLNMILTTILKKTNADSGSLMLLDETANELRIHAYKGLPKHIAQKTRISFGESIAGLVAQNKTPVLINNNSFSIKFKRKPRRNLKSSMSIPLLAGKKLIGVINLNRRIGKSILFTTKDIKALTDFSSECATAILNAKFYIDAEEKIQYLFRFNVISCALNSALDQEKLINVLSDCIYELYNFDFYSLLYLDNKTVNLFIFTKKNLNKTVVNHIQKNLTSLAAGLKKETLSDRKIILYIKKLKTKKIKLKRITSPSAINSVLNAPIITKGNTMGMLSIYSTEKHIFTQKDQQSFTTLANQTAIALENTILYKNLRKTYFSTIKALAQAIEEKDEYTRGHSELVSYYATCIAQKMNLSSRITESIQIAGILHDIGKIGIPENILSKPTTLTESEFKIIKNHPKIGTRILHPVDFLWSEYEESPVQSVSEVSMFTLSKVENPLKNTIEILKTIDISEEIIAIIYHHHERFGGNGYPAGLKGEEIPIGARILAVADTFEAMTANRPYRKSFPLKKALRLLKECSPNQLDPAIVDIFIKNLKTKKIPIKKVTKNKEGLKLYG